MYCRNYIGTVSCVLCREGYLGVSTIGGCTSCINTFVPNQLQCKADVSFMGKHWIYQSH